MAKNPVKSILSDFKSSPPPEKVAQIATEQESDRGGTDHAPKPEVPSQRQSFLDRREATLAQMQEGSRVDETILLVDPEICRIWEFHDRDYAMLDRDRCNDLIESIIAQNEQQFPAIVRKIENDPVHKYEVIAGSRRHWSIKWLRANNYPDLKYKIKVVEAKDEKAFRIAELENGARKDISVFERGLSYHRALHMYYGGKNNEMARRIGKDKGYISRLVSAAIVPEIVIQAYGGKGAVPQSVFSRIIPKIKKALSDDHTEEELARYNEMLVRAREIKEQREIAISKGAKVLSGDSVTTILADILNQSETKGRNEDEAEIDRSASAITVAVNGKMATVTVESSVPINQINAKIMDLLESKAFNSITIELKNDLS